VPGLTDIHGTFDHYLDGRADHPVGVAVSGGGDSVALLYRLAEWGRRPLHVFCVDHGINPLSAEWTAGVVRHAEAVGAKFKALHWIGEKPATGLAAAARAARHALLADAARQAGVRVLCLAHTADDIAEAQLMRAQGSSVGAPAIWSPSPAWPEGCGVFLFRPLLRARREELRIWLRARGISWIDDPANENPASLRAQARQVLAGKTDVAEAGREPPVVERLLPSSWAELGLIHFDPQHPPDRPVLSAAAVSAGGRDRLPRRDSVERLRDAVAGGKAMTLCGARIENGVIVRDFGDIRRNGRPAVRLEAGREIVWDGRFVVKSSHDAVVRPSGDVRPALSRSDRALLQTLPAALRTVLPAVDFGKGPVLALPQPDDHCETVRSRCLVWPRFAAATGAVTRESDLATDV